MRYSRGVATDCAPDENCRVPTTNYQSREFLMLNFDSVKMDFPSDANIVIGQSHFIKTVEDIYEAVVTTVPQAKFGLAFNESSGPCLTRSEGNDDELRSAAVRNALGVVLANLKRPVSVRMAV